MWPSQRLASIGLDSRQRKFRARSRDRRGIRPIVTLLEERTLLSHPGTWAIVAPLPTARDYLGATTGKDGTIYAIGGYGSQGRSSEVDAYNPATNTWRTVAPLPVTRIGLEVETGTDGTIYAIGGADWNNQASSNVYAYNPATNIWTQVASMPTEHAFFGAAVGNDGTIYAIGGENGSTYMFGSETDAYNPNTNTWTKVADLPPISYSVGRYELTAAAGKDGTIYVIGGLANGVGVTNSVEAYNPTTNTWTQVAYLPTPRYDLTATTGADGIIYAIGGYTDSTGTKDETYAYNPSINAWTELASLPSDSPYFETGLASTTGIDGTVYVIGQRDTSHEVDAYTPIFTPTINITPYNTIYDGQSYTATGTVTGVNGESLIGLDLSQTTHANAGIYGGDTWTFTDNTGYYNSFSGTITDVITKATPVVHISLNASSHIYNGQPFVASTATVNGNYALEGVSTTIDYQRLNANGTWTDLFSSAPAQAGHYEVTASFAGSGDYASVLPSAPLYFDIFKANATINVTPYNETYDGRSYTAIGTVTGVSGNLIGLNLSGTTHTNVATYTDRWTFTDMTGNYNNASGTITDVIAKATPTITILPTASGITYGQTLASSTLNGGNASVAGSFTWTTPVTAPSAGSPPESVTFTPTDTADYNDATAGVLINVQQATPTFSELTTSPTIVYGTSTTTLTGHLGSGTAYPTGSDVSITLNSFTQTASVDGSGDFTTTFSTRSLGVAGGPYTVTYAFAGNSSFTAATDTSTTLTVIAAPLTASIIGDPTKTYDGTTSATLTQANFSLSGLVGTQSFTVTQTVGTYNSKDVTAATTVMASLPPSDFTPRSGTVASNYILPTTASGAGTITPKALTYSGLSVPASKVYDGTTTAEVSGTAALQTAEAAGTGSTADGKPYSVDSVSLTGTPTGTYNSKDVATATTVTFGGLALTGTGNGDYTLTASTQAATITPRTVTASIIGDPSKTYNGSTSATLSPSNFSLTGVISGESLTVNQAAGTYNSKDVSTATTVTASLSAGNFTPGSGTLASDYTLPTTASGAGNINRAPLTVSATNESMTYGGTVPTPLTYTYTGLVNNDTSATFSGSLVTTATSSSSVGDYPITMGTLAATGNYTVGTYNPSTLIIAKADITVTPYDVTYDGNVHNATGTTLTGLVINSAHTNAGIYTDSWAYTDPNGNYNSSTGIITDTIAKATASINVAPYSVTYDGNFHTATGVITGVNGVGLSELTVSSAHTNSGTYADGWVFSDTTGNYNNASGTITDTIAKANASIGVYGYNTFYNAVSHIAIGAVYGVNGVALSGLNLSNTVHTNVGTNTDVWTFTDTTGNYNNTSGTVVDTITPSKSKMVRETVLVPKTTAVKATVLVPVIKEVKVVERVKVGSKWVKKTIFVPETVMVKKTVLVNVTKMAKKTEMVRVYYS